MGGMAGVERDQADVALREQPRDLVGVDLGRVDDLRVREAPLDLSNPALDETLPLLRGVVVGIFREISVRAGLGNRRDDRRSIDRLQTVQLGLEALRALHRHRNFLGHVTAPG